jgi:hypothetical protein
MINQLANVTLAGLALFTAIVLGMWVREDGGPTEFREEHIKEPVRAGDRAIVDYIVTRKRNDCKVKIERFLWDGRDVRIAIPSMEDEFEAAPGPLGDQEFQEYVLIPEYAFPGDGMLRTQRSYKCNPLQRAGFIRPMVVRTPDVPVKILPKLEEPEE